ncbi:MAG TPA: hypothetical protein PLJ21_05645 [Pseudobdellovibrionaceae bacterium]|nr:hypothetical protein [Pseudobdellovibrionaceae bacterium]
MKSKTIDFIFNDLAFKLIALLMSLVLWVLVSGRRDYVASKTMDLEFILGANYILKDHNVDQVRIKVSGPRLALRNFMDSALYNSLNISLRDFKSGKHQIEFKRAQVELPVGVEIVEIRPEKLYFELIRRDENVEENKQPRDQ